MIKILITVLCIIGLYNNYRNDRVVSSSSLWVLCYLLIFVITPLVSENKYNNEGLIDVLSLIGIITFSCGSVFGNKVKIEDNRVSNSSNRYISFSLPYKLFLFVFIITVVLLIFILGTQGVVSVLNGNITSKQMALSDDFSVTSLLEWVQQLLIPLIMAVWISAESIVEHRKRIICLVLFSAEMIFFSFTRLFFVCVLLIILFHELKALERKKQLLLAIVAFVFLGIGMVMLNYIRCLGIGSVNWENIINIDSIMSGTDFAAAYKYFNKLLNFESPYICPVVYLRVFFAFIPRSFWATKPEGLNIQIMKYIDPFLAEQGQSAGMSILGEAYALAGYLGILVFPFIWGAICSYFDRKFYIIINKKKSALFEYYYYIFATFIVISGHRGDWGTYIIQIVWLYMLPLLIMSKYRQS